MLGIMPEQVFALSEKYIIIRAWERICLSCLSKGKVKNLGETDASLMETFILSVNLCLEYLKLSDSKKKICKERIIYRKE